MSAINIEFGYAGEGGVGLAYNYPSTPGGSVASSSFGDHGAPLYVKGFRVTRADPPVDHTVQAQVELDMRQYQTDWFWDWSPGDVGADEVWSPVMTPSQDFPGVMEVNPGGALAGWSGGVMDIFNPCGTDGMRLRITFSPTSPALSDGAGGFFSSFQWEYLWDYRMLAYIPQPDSYSGTDAAQVSGNILANDFFPSTFSPVVTAFRLQGQSSFADAGQTTTQAGVGSLTILADGSLVFSPVAGVPGDFAFQYRLAHMGEGSLGGGITIAADEPQAGGDQLFGLVQWLTRCTEVVADGGAGNRLLDLSPAQRMVRNTSTMSTTQQYLDTVFVNGAMVGDQHGDRIFSADISGLDCRDQQFCLEARIRRRTTGLPMSAYGDAALFYFGSWAVVLTRAGALAIRSGAGRVLAESGATTIVSTGAGLVDTSLSAMPGTVEVACDRDSSGVVRLFLAGQVVATATWNPPTTEDVSLSGPMGREGLAAFVMFNEVRMTVGRSRHAASYAPHTEPFPNWGGDWDPIPTAPLTLAGSPTDTTITATWGGVTPATTIDTWRVQLAPAGTLFVSSTEILVSGAAAHTALFTGLLPSTAYDLRVRGENGSGSGAWRTLLNIVTTGARTPGAPTNVVATLQAATTVGLTWQAPADHGTYPITDYVVQYALAGTSFAAPVTVSDGVSTTLSAVIASMAAQTEFEFRVAAINAAGIGAWGMPADSLTTAGGIPPRCLMVDGLPVMVDGLYVVIYGGDNPASLLLNFNGGMTDETGRNEFPVPAGATYIEGPSSGEQAMRVAGGGNSVQAGLVNSLIIGSSPFTLQARCRFRSAFNGRGGILLCKNYWPEQPSSGFSVDYVVTLRDGGVTFGCTHPSGTTIPDGYSNERSCSFGPILDAWFHWSITDDGTLMHFHVNGVLIVSLPTMVGNTLPLPSTPDSRLALFNGLAGFLGSSPNFGGSGFDGDIDGLMLTIGVALYGAGNYTPPTGPFTQD